jgi:hypothetical protein
MNDEYWSTTMQILYPEKYAEKLARDAEFKKTMEELYKQNSPLYPQFKETK